MTIDKSLVPLPSPTQLTAEQFKTLAAVPYEGNGANVLNLAYSPA